MKAGLISTLLCLQLATSNALAVDRRDTETTAVSSSTQSPTTNSSTSTHKKSQKPKRGLVYTDDSVTSLFPKPPITWAYNYQSSPGSNATNDFEFVPMLYNGVDPDWQTNVAAAKQRGSKHLLAMNEPDQPTSAGGTALSPAAAAQMYQALMNPFAGQMQLGAPAVSAGGISWLKEFAQACNGACHVDFIPLHFYNDASSVQTQAVSFTGFMTSTIPQVRSFFGDNSLPIWVTEFSALPFANVQSALNVEYMDAVLPSLETSTDIARYAYFMADDLTSSGALNPAGQRYLQQ